MVDAVGHAWITGSRRADRRRAVEALGGCHVEVSCHRHFGGPYAGVPDLLHVVAPVAFRNWPELVEMHRVELLYAVPELAETIGPAPATLVSTTPHEERTRYFGNSLIRTMSHGLVSFLLGHHRRLARGGGGTWPFIVAFEHVDAADPTAQEFLALLLRRSDAELLRVIVCSASTSLPADLDSAVRAYSEHRAAVESVPEHGPAQGPRLSDDELAAAYVQSDGASDDPAEYRGYLAINPGRRERLHDERADELMQAACWGVRMGAIPYHRERGSDPAGAGRHALREALEYAVSMGYSATTVDLGMRGRALCDPEVDQVDYCHFSAKAAAAYVALGELAKSEGIYHELRRLYTLPRVHMTTSYGLAMLHTRFHKKRDHDLAKSLQNNAIALAGQEQDPVKRAYLEVFHSNGLALIEMHRGDLKRALDLVTAGLERLDREVPADRYIVHRTQLLHNRARVLSALGRLDEAYVAFSALIEVDRYFPEYHSDRANISRKRGDLLAALADYDQAIEVAPPFAELHYNRGDVRALIGDLPGAVADFEYAVELEPDYLDARVNLACLLLQAGNAPRACRVARAGLAGGNDEPRLLCILGRALQELDEPIAARQAFDRALSVTPDFVPALADRAMLAYGSGDIESAVADLDRALERGGENPDLLYNRGFAYHEMGRYADAVNDFTRALELPGVDRAELTHRRELSRRALAATAA